jgi:predicted nucleic acid-binding protein
MQQKVIIDTNVYIDLFNKGMHKDLVNPFQNITYLAYPVLHELWMGIKNRHDLRLLTAWRDRFIRLDRFIIPNIAAHKLIGEACRILKSKGKLNPTHPKHYNDIVIAALAHQIGAAVMTQNRRDFKSIQTVINFEMNALMRL